VRAHRWICEETHTMLDIDLRQVYRSLFVLLKKKDYIEKHLCGKLNTKKEIVFYDLTSSYVEGVYKDSELIRFGCNRDKKIGKKQVVLGLLLTDAMPVAHKVWEGNTADKTNLREAGKQLQALGMKRFIFVADRGIFTDNNIEWLEDQKLEYITATRRRKDELVQKLMRKPIKTPVKKVYEENKKFYYLCYNEEVAHQQKNDLNQRKKELLEKLRLLKKPTEHKVLELVGKAKRLFTFSFENGFSYSIDEKAYQYEETIAGKFLLVTNNSKLTQRAKTL
jgi:transposase